MIEPIPRFRTLTLEEQHSYEARHIRPSLVKCDDGNLVAYSDYAAIAAENERLRKAGDAFGEALKENPTSLYHIHECVKAWNAAKEGRDAK